MRGATTADKLFPRLPRRVLGLRSVRGREEDARVDAQREWSGAFRAFGRRPRIR
jgi:hypothetical protein